MDHFSKIKAHITLVLKGIEKDTSVVKNDLFDHFMVNNITENSTGNNEFHKEKHAKYEARIFWPSSAQSEVYDLYGFFFNKKYYTHEITEDKYLISENNINIKIRKNEIHIKPYIKQVGNISQFSKKKKIRFPVRGKKISSLFHHEINLDSQIFQTPDDLMKALVKVPEITFVDVHKERYVRKMPGHITIEFSLIQIQGKQWKTICIESKNVRDVLALSLLIHQENAEKLSYNEFLRKYGVGS
jgi:hypothetical protein